MKYDFSTLMDRRGWDAMAVEAPGSSDWAPGGPKEGFDVIPMWVADMNFPTVPTVPKALMERAAHPAYGYFDTRREYYDAILRWQTRRNGAKGLEQRHIGYENGVLGGLLSALRVLCSPGERVLVHAPTYIGFTHSVGNAGYKLVYTPLRRDQDGVWRMDYADMEKKLREQAIHAAILCSPHNPCGRVWERGELEEAMALFRKYNVFVISDEIWSDILRPGYTHIPTQSVTEDARDRTVALYAPSKTFNLAGLVGAYHIIYNDWLRDRVVRESSLCHYNEMNLLSMYALIGAYGPEGEKWLSELNTVLAGNVDYALAYMRGHFHGVEAARPQGTYMLFTDCGGWLDSHGLSLKELERRLWDVGVTVQDGAMFGGKSHVRMNLALPLSRVQEAFDRMDRYVFNREG